MKDNQLQERLVHMVDDILEFCETNYSKVSSKIIRNGKPTSRQNLWKKVHSGSMKVIDLFELLDALHLKIYFAREDEVIYRRPKRQ